MRSTPRLSSRFRDALGFFIAGITGFFVLVILVTYLNTSVLYGVPPTHPLALGLDLACGVCGLLFVGTFGILLGRGMSWLRTKHLDGRKILATLLILAILAAVGAVARDTIPSRRTTRMHRRAAIREEKKTDLTSEQRLSPVSPDPAGRPNVILVTVEAFRPANLNCYGYTRRVTSPNLDTLSRKGVRFTQFYVQAPWTRPSITSYLTSLYPPQHGCLSLESVLGERVPTLPSLLAEAGYQTVMFSTNGNTVDSGFGFQEVVKRYPRSDPPSISPLSSRPFLIRSLMEKIVQQKLQVIFPGDVSRYDVNAERVNARIEEWFAKEMRQPFLLHVHYLDTHAPYLDYPYRLLQLNTPASWNRERRLYYYDRTILRVDRAIEELLGMLRRMGIQQRTIVLITGDHGEEFHEHHGWEHQRTLYQEVLHVPLIAIAPGLLPEGVVVTAPVRSVDIAPTILQLCRLAVPVSFSGQSLLPVILGEERRSRVVLANLQTPVSRWDSIQEGTWKLIRTRDLGLRERLYDLSRDPGETEDVSSSHSQKADSLRQALDGWLGYFARHSIAKKQVTLTPEEREELKALGYVQ
jgi:arylsulfatase A-like enzyme